MLALLASLVIAPTRPLMRDFIGINTHTVQMRPELYKPVTSLLRNYHPVDWDLSGDPGNPAQFPLARNKVDWRALYGSWVKSGYRIDASVMFESVKPNKWTSKSAFEYGKSFARFFGPSGSEKLVECMEIGNEPAELSEAKYREVFEGMAQGIREGDPKMLIATCAVARGKEDKYSKDIGGLAGLEKYIDVVNVHTYAFAEMWPTWRRSYPEDPKIKYLKQVRDMIDWRDRQAPGRKLWVTEFGWDSSTQPPPKTGDFAKFMGNTDEQQAQYLVRSFLVFSAMDVDRAYMYWFNDEDQPTLHAASGLTRHYQPKPSYYALAYLQKTLGDYRFDRVITEKEGEVYAYLFASSKNNSDKIVVVWSPTGSNHTARVGLKLRGLTLDGAHRLPFKEGKAESVGARMWGSEVGLTAEETPIFLTMKGNLY